MKSMGNKIEMKIEDGLSQERIYNDNGPCRTTHYDDFVPKSRLN